MEYWMLQSSRKRIKRNITFTLESFSAMYAKDWTSIMQCTHNSQAHCHQLVNILKRPRFNITYQNQYETSFLVLVSLLKMPTDFLIGKIEINI